ncbi:hypothetical protein [Arthrobacter sp. ISL-30]|uniref:hypothetical protein n=1 Tax=Arthrobacter sp. ISL-30 TaxID=2819109 RepID=UPI001BEA4311|nr:hypothetical protein [Arthrobacter sp. ISL-30]MBT2515529.1 hypothetical protein [Arthrobacter sp. ISL-30]
MDVFDESRIQAEATREAMDQAGLRLSEVWMRYFSFTGVAGEYEVDAYLNGSFELPAHERDLIAHAVNELINELPPPRAAPYSNNETTPWQHLYPSEKGNAPQDRK